MEYGIIRIVIFPLTGFTRDGETLRSMNAKEAFIMQTNPESHQTTDSKTPVTPPPKK